MESQDDLEKLASEEDPIKRLRIAREIMEKDSEWFNEHKEELRKKYGGRYYAIFQCSILDYDKKQDRLLDRIRGKYGLISFYLGDLNEPFVRDIDSIIYEDCCEEI